MTTAVSVDEDETRFLDHLIARARLNEGLSRAELDARRAASAVAREAEYASREAARIARENAQDEKDRRMRFFNDLANAIGHRSDSAQIEKIKQYAIAWLNRDDPNVTLPDIDPDTVKLVERVFRRVRTPRDHRRHAAELEERYRNEPLRAGQFRA